MDSPLSTMGEAESPQESWFKHYAESVPRFAWGDIVEIPSDLDEVRKLQTRIEQAVLDAGWPDTDYFNFKTALEEAMVDAVKHGNELRKDKKVKVRSDITEDRIAVAIQDEGEGFDPFDVPDPTVPENLERPNGRGLKLIDAFMDGWRYEQPTKTLYIWKNRKRPELTNGQLHSTNTLLDSHEKINKVLGER